MNYKHIDHSLCYLDDKYLFVTGSYLKDDKMHETCERYDVKMDRWAKFPPLSVGRCHHSSCSVDGRYVFVICGLIIVRHEYQVVSEEDNGMVIIKEEFHWQATNTIERFDAANKTAGWLPMNIPDTPLVPRRSPGVLQVSGSEILIFGGSKAGGS